MITKGSTVDPGLAVRCNEPPLPALQHTFHDSDQSAQQRPNACAQGDGGHALDHRSADDEPEAGLVLPGDRLVAVTPLPCCPCQQCNHQESGDYAAEGGANRGRVCLRPWLVFLHLPRVWDAPVFGGRPRALPAFDGHRASRPEYG